MTPLPALRLLALFAFCICACVGAGQAVSGTSDPLRPSTLGPQEDLEPFDAVRIECPAHPALQADLMIDNLGVAMAPLRKRVVLAGMTVEKAGAKLRQIYEAEMAVELGSFRLILIRNPQAPVRYSGAIKKQGTLFAARGLKLSEILSTAQPTRDADLEAIQIRSGEIIRVVRSDADVELRAGDKVFVPRLDRVKQVFVLGAVAKPGVFDFKLGLTAKQAVELAGGATPAGDVSKVEIRRGGQTLGAVDFQFGDAPLEVGDTVTVLPLKDPPYVLVVGGAVRPGKVLFKAGMTLTQAIVGAGGVKKGQVKGKINVVRNENGRRTSKSYDLAAVLNGQQPAIQLKSGDRVELPESFP